MLGSNLCHYLPCYDNILLLGDFNSEINEEALAEFCSLFNLSSLIKVPTCFKNPENPSCIDLILTNRPRSFQNSNVSELGLSDFHKLTVTVLKTSFRKKPPKIIKYRNYKHYSENSFRNELNNIMNGIEQHKLSNDDYVTLFMEVFNRHAPIKMKYVRANENPFITKELRKEHMKRTRLRNKYYKQPTDINSMAYKKQRNKCVLLLKKAKRDYFSKLNPSVICTYKHKILEGC